MLKFYKKLIPTLNFIQIFLFVIILIIGIFAIRTGVNYPGEYFFYADPLNQITISFQLIFFASILHPTIKMYKNSLARIRLLAILNSVFYFILTTLYLFGPFGGYYGGVVPNLAAETLKVFWIISGMLFFISFLSSSFFSFIAPRYKNEKQINRLKSKNSRVASNKIRDLKKLLDEGIISKEVFDEKSKKYIEEL